MKSKMLTLLALILYSNLPAATNFGNTTQPQEPQTEFEQLSVIMAKYGNNAEGAQAINYAILQEDEPAIDLLLKYGATLGESSLGYARRTGNLDLLKKVFALGVRTKSYDGSLIIWKAILDHQNDIARYLIDYGPQLDYDYLKYRNDDCLSNCARVGNLEMYNYLVSKGVENKDPRFFSTLICISNQKYAQEKIEMATYLLDQHIIDPNHLGGNYNNYPLLFMAADPRGGKYALEMMRMLLERGANATALDSNDLNIFMSVHLLTNPSNAIDESDEHFNTKKEMIELLVEYGADINYKDSRGDTVLKYAKGSRMIAFLKSLGAE